MGSSFSYTLTYTKLSVLLLSDCAHQLTEYGGVLCRGFNNTNDDVDGDDNKKMKITTKIMKKSDNDNSNDH